MSTFLRGITEAIPSLFRGIFMERNSVANPRQAQAKLSLLRNVSLKTRQLERRGVQFSNTVTPFREQTITACLKYKKA